MVIQENEGLILTLKGTEQFHAHTDKLDTAQTWLLEVVNQEQDFENILKHIIANKVDKSSLDFLIDNHYIRVVDKDKIKQEQQLIHEQFLMQQTNFDFKIGASQKSFDAFDFIRSDKKIENYMDKIDTTDITIMPNKNDSIYSTGANNASVNEEEGSVSTKTPEAKAFEEIKEVIKSAIKDAFSIKSYVYSFQLSKVNNISDLNSFFGKIFPQIQKSLGDEYCEELMNKIKIISANYNL